MNEQELLVWSEAVDEHMAMLETTINDRRELKTIIETHLKQFFEWDRIEYNRDFSRIELFYALHHNPVFKTENMGGLGMDFIVRADYDDSANRIVVVELYPFGLPKEGELIED